MPLQQSSSLGQVAVWEVGAWTEGGNVPDARIQLASTAGAGAPVFSFGCASGEGTSVCDLGAVDASSAQRLFQAEVTVPVTAASITAVSLTATGSAADLAIDPAASSSIVVAPGAASSSALPTLSPAGFVLATPTPTPTTGAGGSAADLFPTVALGSPQTERATPVADVSKLSGGSPAGAQIAEVAGLAALAGAMFLAVTRLSVRRPAARHAASSSVAAPPPPEGRAERHQ